MKYIGGYSILDLASATIYKDALALANVDKPILVYPENDKPVFADTFLIDSDNDLVVITIGGLTITIADDNTITTSGNIQPNTLKLYRHTITIGSDKFEIINEKSTAYTVQEILTYLLTHSLFSQASYGPGSFYYTMLTNETGNLKLLTITYHTDDNTISINKNSASYTESSDSVTELEN